MDNKPKQYWQDLVKGRDACDNFFGITEWLEEDKYESGMRQIFITGFMAALGWTKAFTVEDLIT